MIQGKKGPYILILFLIITLCFVAGMQYGKIIEKSDKSNQIVLSITPSESPTKSPSSRISFKTYTQDICGIEFLYPSTLLTSQEASRTATLINADTNQSISINCDGSMEQLSTASSEAQLDGQVATAYEKDDLIQYQVQNLQGQRINITLSKELNPLFISSFAFLE